MPKSLAQFRQENPDYADVDDETLADALHRKFYSEMPRAEFFTAVGVGAGARAPVTIPAAAPTVTAPPAPGQEALAELMDLRAAQETVAPAPVRRPSLSERFAAHVGEGFNANTLLGSSVTGGAVPADAAQLALEERFPEERARREARDEAKTVAAVLENRRAAALRGMPDSETPLEYLAAVGGELVGSAGSPENLIVPGATKLYKGLRRFAGPIMSRLITRGVQTAVPNVVTDPLIQQSRVEIGAQDEIDPWRTGISAALGFGLGAGGSAGAQAYRAVRDLIARGRGVVPEAVKPDDLRPEDITPEVLQILQANGIINPQDAPRLVAEATARLSARQDAAAARTAEIQAAVRGTPGEATAAAQGVRSLDQLRGAQGQAEPIVTEGADVRAALTPAPSVIAVGPGGVAATRGPDVPIATAPGQPPRTAPGPAQVAQPFEAGSVAGQQAQAAIEQRQAPSFRQQADTAEIAAQINEDPLPLVSQYIGLPPESFQTLTLDAKQRVVAAAQRARQAATPGPTLRTSDAALSLAPDEARGGVVRRPPGAAGTYSPASTPQPGAVRIPPGGAAEVRGARQQPTAAEMNQGGRDQPGGRAGYARTAAGTSDRPFRADDGTDAEFFEGQARDRADAARQASNEDLQQQWKTYEDVINAFRARAEQQRPDESTQARYQKAKTSSTTKEPDKDGRFEVDKDGYVKSDKGGPVMYSEHGQAAKWIINVGQKKSPDQFFEIANHPSGKGLTVRERGRSEAAGDAAGADARQAGAQDPPGGEKPARDPNGESPPPAEGDLSTQVRSLTDDGQDFSEVREGAGREGTGPAQDQGPGGRVRADGQDQRPGTPEPAGSGRAGSGQEPGRTDAPESVRPGDEENHSAEAIAEWNSRLPPGSTLSVKNGVYEIKRKGQPVAGGGATRKQIERAVEYEKRHAEADAARQADKAETVKQWRERSTSEASGYNLYGQTPKAAAERAGWNDRLDFKPRPKDADGAKGWDAADRWVQDNPRPAGAGKKSPDAGGEKSPDAAIAEANKKLPPNYVFKREGTLAGLFKDGTMIGNVSPTPEALAREAAMRMRDDPEGKMVPDRLKGKKPDGDIREHLDGDEARDNAILAATDVVEGNHDRLRAALQRGEKEFAAEVKKVLDGFGGRDFELENGMRGSAEHRSGVITARLGGQERKFTRYEVMQRLRELLGAGGEKSPPTRSKPGSTKAPAAKDVPRTQAQVESMLDRRDAARNEPTLTKDQKGQAQAVKDEVVGQIEAATASEQVVWRQQAATARDEGARGFVAGAGRGYGGEEFKGGWDSRVGGEDTPKRPGARLTGWDAADKWMAEHPAPEGKSEVTLRTVRGAETKYTLNGEAEEIEELAKRIKRLPLTRFYSNPLDPELWKELFGPMIGKEASRWADELGQLFSDLKNSSLKEVGRGLADYGRILAYPNQMMMDAIAKRFGQDGEHNPAIRKLHDMFFTAPGRKAERDLAYGEAIDRRVQSDLNRLAKVLAPFDSYRLKEQEQILEQIARLIVAGKVQPGTSKVHDAAAEIQKMLREWHAYGKEAGVEMGDVGKNFFPRELAEEKVLAHPKEFLADAEAQYRADGLSPQEAAKAAAAWLQRIQESDLGFRSDGNDFVQVPRGTGTKHENARTLSQSADTRLDKWYNRNVADVLPLYFLRMARRAEWVRRMGPNLEKWEALKQEIVDSGAGEAIPELVRTIQSATGATAAPVGYGKRAVLSVLRVAGITAYLPRALLSSLSEPILAATRTGRATDAIKAYTGTVRDMLRQISGIKDPASRVAAARELAEDLGLVAQIGDDMLMAQRFGGQVDGRIARKITNRFFLYTGLHHFTEATRVASTSIGQIFMRRLAKSLDGTYDKSTRFLLDELGIAGDDAAKFAKFVNSFPNGIPGPDVLRASKDPMAEAYRNAIHRFVTQVALKPGASERARGASNPWISLFYQLQSYNYGFQVNVLNRFARLGAGAFRAPGMNVADRLRLLAPMAWFASMAIPLQYAIGEAREIWQKDPGVDPALQNKTEGEKWLRALSRAGLGIADLPVNMFSSVKYGKTAAEAMVGPVLGGINNALDAVTGVFDDEKNSPNTQTAERRLAKVLYSNFLQPLMISALSLMPGKVGAALAIPGIQYVAKPSTRDKAVTAVAGEPEFRKDGGGRESRREGGREGRRESSR